MARTGPHLALTGTTRALGRFAAPVLLLAALGGAGVQAPAPPADTPPAVALSAAADARPNILLVVTDDQREGTVTPAIMPNVHREFDRRGFRFTRAFVTNPWCCPSRASILTGQYSHTNGVWTVGPPAGITAWFPHEDSTLATWLHQAGYRTGIVGKYLNGYGKPAVPAYKPPGWGTTAIVADLDYQDSSGYFDYDIFDGTGLVHYGSEPSDYSTRVLTDRALGFLAPSSTAQPWFLYLAYTSPHGPAVHDPVDEDAARGVSYPMPPNVCEQDVSDKPAFVRGQPPCTRTQAQFDNRMRSQQAQMLASVDRGLGRILSLLETTGQMSNTLILFISDNGVQMGSHRLLGKEVPYEESIRVPLLMRWDALGAPPRRIGGLALNIDLAPTITDAAGVTTHNAYDGTSLLPLLDGSATWVRRSFLVEHLSTGPSDPGGPSYCAVRSDRYKYVEYATGERELYDLREDPAELTSRHDDVTMQATMNRLRQRMLQLCDPAPPGWTPR
ncbi:sulfatase family protein [Nocardioides pyridinolyticus]